MLFPFLVPSPSPSPANTGPNITPGDWLGAGVGIASFLATILLAFLIYRLQRRDAERDNAENRRIAIMEQEAQERRIAQEKAERENQRRADEAQRRADEEQRELRRARRERHQADYQLAANALHDLDTAFELPAMNDPYAGALLTKGHMQAAKVLAAKAALLQVAANVTTLRDPLTSLAHHADKFFYCAVSAHEQLQKALSRPPTERTDRPSLGQNPIAEEIFRGILQREVAIRGKEMIRAARAAMEKEWGS
ncbi:hypothetical protein [Micromonospora chalcea]|uniref:hypothetical protein n=1 Tax=Micromonospora chalcea TaxID=1874 RepID=UPI0033D30372